MIAIMDCLILNKKITAFQAILGRYTDILLAFILLLCLFSMTAQTLSNDMSILE